MSTKINDDTMSLEIDGRVVATAEFSERAAADGHGAWIVSCHPGRLFARNQAITAMVLAERLAPRGAWAQASWPRWAPTWRTALATARSAHWSAHGPPWRWSAHLSC